jgi:hypothetical protein
LCAGQGDVVVGDVAVIVVDETPDVVVQQSTLSTPAKKEKVVVGMISIRCYHVAGCYKSH